MVVPAFVAVVTGLLVSTALAGGTAVSINVPPQVVQGQKATINASAIGYSGSCSLTIRYKGGRVWTAARSGGSPSWTFRVPAVPPGPAHVVVRCGASSASATMSVQWALQPVNISVGKRGFTQRPQRFGTGRDVNYAVAVHNDSVRFDATNVDVLVNFVAADNSVVGSDHRSLIRLPADSTFYVGAQATTSTRTAVTRLEVIITSTPAYKQPAKPPLVSDIAFLPSAVEPTQLGTVQLQVLNSFTQPFAYAAVGVAILDGAGNIIGGGSAQAQGPVKPNARELVISYGSYSAVPLASAASALVSVVPRYPTKP